MPRVRGLGYWLPLVLGILTLCGIFASASVRLTDAERKTAKIDGLEWDVRLVKAMLAATNPAKYDSVLTNQVRIYGTRP